MTDKIRVGIVGATVTQGGSGWGANAHVPALKALPGYELKAVCTSREDTAKASAAAFGVDHAFHRFSDMAAHPEVDLIVVCVRVPGHRDLVMAGLQAGKPVLCEWPLGANLAELGRLMDKLPNMYTEIGAVLYELGRQPRGSAEFFTKYQDRIMFGKDTFEPSEYPYYWRVLETRDEYFYYYRSYHAFWKMYGLNLPDDVLKKLYYKNALRILPGINPGAFPK